MACTGTSLDFTTLYIKDPFYVCTVVRDPFFSPRITRRHQVAAAAAAVVVVVVVVVVVQSHHLTSARVSWGYTPVNTGLSQL
jgi:hypothetical protein